MVKIILLNFFITSILWGTTPINKLILEEINTMPKGGGYSVKDVAFTALESSVQLNQQHPTIHLRSAIPSFCSSATYLVFLKTILKLESRNKLSPDVLNELQFKGESDGVGFWGRWNANGPGVAKLVTDLKLGNNFQDYSKAMAGDFMKIFWSNEIGKKEHGHLVVFLESETRGGQEYIKFWSSNQPDGYGIKEVPKSKIKWAIFSRIHHPKNISNITKLPKLDQFTADMLKKSFSRSEVIEACKIK